MPKSEAPYSQTRLRLGLYIYVFHVILTMKSFQTDTSLMALSDNGVRERQSIIERLQSISLKFVQVKLRLHEALAWIGSSGFQFRLIWTMLSSARSSWSRILRSSIKYRKSGSLSDRVANSWFSS